MANPNASTQNLFYTAQYNGKTVSVLADCGELALIESCLEQCPELHIELEDGQWQLHNRPVSESDVFEYLVNEIPFGDEPEAPKAPAAVQAIPSTARISRAWYQAAQSSTLSSSSAQTANFAQ